MLRTIPQEGFALRKPARSENLYRTDGHGGRNSLPAITRALYKEGSRNG